MNSSGDDVVPSSVASGCGGPGRQDARHVAYFVHSPVAIMVADGAGRYVEVNPAACRTTGYDESELLAMSITDLLAEESREAGVLHFRRVREVGRADGEFCWLRKDGERRWSTCDVVKLADDRYIGFFSDVTQRKQTEDALSRSRAELRAIYDHAPVMMCVIDTDRRVVFCNRAMATFCSKVEEEIIGDRACGILGCIKALDDPRGCGYGPHCTSCPLRLAILDTFETGRPHQGIDYQATVEQDGSRRDVVCLASTSRIQHGGQSTLLLCLEDITERARAEELQRQSEERYRLLVEASPCSILVVQDGRYVFANPYAGRMMGYSPDELVRVPVLDTVHPDSRDPVLQRIKRLEAGKANAPLEVKLLRKDGRPVESETVSVPVMYNGHPAAIVVGQDITARKTAEERVRLLAALLDASPTSTTVHDREGRFLYANEKTFVLHGCSAEEFYQLNLHQLDVPDSARLFEERVREITEKGSASFDVEHYRRDGTRIPLRVDAKFARWGDQDVLLSVASDVSDLKRTEEALRERQARLRGILDAVSESVFLIDREGIVLECNATTTRRLGKGVDDLLGNCVFDFLPQDLARSRRLQLDRVVESRQPVQFEDHRDGVWFEHTIYPVFGEGGAISEFAIFGRDISERKRSDEQLQLQSLVLNQIQDRVTITDLEGVITYVNDAECETLQRSRESLIGQSVRVYGEDPLRGARQQEVIETTLREGEWRGEIVNYAADGSEIIIDTRTSLIFDLQGQPVAMCGIGTDITQRKRAEQEKLEMERRLLYAQKLESLGILAGGVAHDFNNILAGIMGYADLLKLRLPASEPAREDVDVIKRAVQRAADLTRQMLAYSGKGKFVVEAADLSRIVEDAQSMLGMSVSKRATLIYNLADDLPAIEVDASQIHQVILNLVINASESLGEQNGVIAVSTDVVELTETDCACLNVGKDRTPGTYVSLIVADTGCGMDRETLAKVFDPFFTTKFTGRGLGMAAVHGIVLAQQGGIRVISEPGRGSTFQVVFPACGKTSPSPAAEPPAEAWHGTGTVLVVDDEEIIRTTAQRMIEHAGFQVLTARDGEEAIELYRKRQAEVVCVVLDLTMPKRGGEETLRELCKIRPDVRVILSSGYSEENATERFSELGLAGFLQKPFELSTMISQLRKALAAG